MAALRRCATERSSPRSSVPVAPSMNAPGEHVQLSRFDTELGPVTLATSEQGVLCCTLPGTQHDKIGAWLARHVPRAVVHEGVGRNRAIIRKVKDFCAGKRVDLGDVPLDLRGTDFQVDVWRTLVELPRGATISYGELAHRAGYPRASRACGSANGANPVPLFVPCHRVIAGDGTLGGFGGRLDLKRQLLEMEGVDVR